MHSDRNRYREQFQLFLEDVYRKDGLAGIANCLPFVTGAFVITADGKLVAANDRFLNLVGYDMADLMNQEALMVVYPEDRDLVRRRLEEENDEAYLLRLLTKDRQIKYVSVSPTYFVIDGVNYRLSEFMDNSELVSLNKQRIDALRKTAQALGNTIEKRDPYTHGHMYRTSVVARHIAELMGLDHEKVESIELGASIHDIGKITIPIEILIKPSKLEQFEWDFIKTHPESGHQILKDIEFVETVKEIILMHHECQDGSGYPMGLTANEIPIEVSIVTVADCLEAIAGVRPYRQAYTFEDAIEVMKSEASRYQEEALTAVVSLVENGKLTGREFGLH